MLCAQCGFRLCPAVFLLSSPCVCETGTLKGEESDRRARATERNVYAHLQAFLRGYSTTRQVCGRVSALGTQEKLAEASSLSTFSSHLCREPLIVSHRVRALLMPQSHADSSTCLEHYTVGELGQLSKMSRSLPLQGMQHNASLLSWKHIKH